jgi:hypothetical protein
MHTVQAIAVTHHGSMYFVKVPFPEKSKMYNFHMSYMAFVGEQSILPCHRFGRALLPHFADVLLLPKLIFVINTSKHDIVDCTDKDKTELHMYFSEFEQRYSAPYCIDKTQS